MLLRIAIALLALTAFAAGQARPDPDWIQRKMAEFERAPEAIHLAPKPGKQTFNIGGDARRVWDAIGTGFGLHVTYDENIPTRPVQYRLQDVDFTAASDVAAQMTRTFFVPVSATEILVANDTPAKRRELERYVMRTFYFQNIGSAQELNDMVNLLRTVFEVRFLVPQPANNSIEVRAPQATIDSIDRFLSSMATRQPEVMIDVQVLEVNRSMLQTIGVNLPLQFQMFNIGAAALAALNSPNIQNLINQLLANGGLTSGNTGSLAALIGQLQNQSNSLLANPVATFGGGLTLFGVGIPPITGTFQRNDSRITNLEHTQLRASDGNAANIHIGTRLPVLTQSFSTGTPFGSLGGNTAANLNGVIPGFQYQDLGVSLKATPNVHGTDSVTLNLELSVRTAGAQQFNNVPIINNREYKGVISVKNNEPAVLAGMISRSESRSIQGLPIISNIPIIGRLGSTDTNNETDSELLVILTPRITAARETSASVILMPKSGQ